MAFFARPDLSNEQFKQLSGSTLTLSGTTQIASSTGLTFWDGTNQYRPLIVTGGTQNDVLTLIGNEIRFAQSLSGVTGGVYPYNESATTTVGGLVAGTNLYNVLVVDILQDILVPTQFPTLTSPSSTFTISPSSTIYEVGNQIVFTGCSTFNQGCINPQYTATCDKRSGVPISYVYINFDLISTTCTSSALSNTYVMPSRIITSGVNSVNGNVCYSAGVQPFDSTGAAYCSPLGAGTTSAIFRTVTGIYPWFWGKSASTPTPNQALISGCTCKCVASSTGNITVTNFGALDEYIWFAIPAASTSKTCWQGANNPSNNGVIPGALFPTPTTVSINSPENCWNGESYKIYVSNYATSVNYGMTFCN